MADEQVRAAGCHGGCRCCNREYRMRRPRWINLDDYRHRGDVITRTRQSKELLVESVSERSGFDYGPYPITGGNTGANSGSAGAATQDHIGQLLRILGLGGHARPESPAAVMEHEIIPAVKALAALPDAWAMDLLEEYREAHRISAGCRDGQLDRRCDTCRDADKLLAKEKTGRDE